MYEQWGANFFFLIQQKNEGYLYYLSILWYNSSSEKLSIDGFLFKFYNDGSTVSATQQGDGFSMDKYFMNDTMIVIEKQKQILFTTHT